MTIMDSIMPDTVNDRKMTREDFVPPRSSSRLHPSFKAHFLWHEDCRVVLQFAEYRKDGETYEIRKHRIAFPGPEDISFRCLVPYETLRGSWRYTHDSQISDPIKEILTGVPAASMIYAHCDKYLARENAVELWNELRKAGWKEWRKE